MAFTIPENITVHLGPPGSPAENVTIPFPEYISNVASSEIYPTWPENAIRANMYAQISYALNRVYTEWYRSQGYDFDITNSTAYDQSFVPGRDIFENIERLTGELFNDYLRRPGTDEPLFAAYCDGQEVTCPGLSQWGSVALANQGKTPFEILTNYYGDNLEIVRNAPVSPRISSFQRPLSLTDIGEDVRRVQVQLNRVSRNYPAIPKVPTDGIFGAQTRDAVEKFQEIFGLSPSGTVDRATWYRLAYLYVSVKRLAEPVDPAEFSAGIQPYPGFVLTQGMRNEYVSVLQNYLIRIAALYPDIPATSITGYFGTATRAAVLAFQRKFGLTPDGVVGPATWDALLRAYDDADSSRHTHPGQSIGELREGASDFA